MIKILKKLPFGQTVLAIAFLIIQAGCTLYLPYVMADIVNKGVLSGDTTYIWQKGGIMLILSVGSLIGAILNVLVSTKIAFKLGAKLREEIYEKTMKFSKKEFDEFGTATLITRNTNDVTQVQTFIEMALKVLILSPVYLIGGITLTWWLAPQLAMVFIAAIPFMAIGSFLIYRYATPLFMKMQKGIDSLNLFFREGLTGARVIRAFNKEDAEYEKYRAGNRDYTKTAIKAGTIMSVIFPFIVLVMGAATIGLVWLGGKRVESSAMPIGTLMAAISYSAQILSSFAILASVIMAVPRGQISAGRIMEIINTSVSISNGSGENTKGSRLAFENVDFRYHGAEKKTLENINFDMDKGQTLAIVGSTGDGKTTLINLISRLYDVENGAVKIGGVNVCGMKLHKLREQVSLTPQKSTLFFGTIRSNMLTAKPNATDDEIWAALEISHAKEFLNTLDDKVEKGGSNFSGGQKQRLCIARTLLKDAAVYIFDDSFSALDFKTDSEVRRAMKDRLQNAITVIVAQRISTIRTADKILVLDDGKVAGLGKHDELLVGCPTYREIVDSQIHKEAVA